MSEEFESQTHEATVDDIQKYIMDHKELRDITYTFLANPSGTFLFNVLDNANLTNQFNKDPELFPLLVKKALLRLLDEWTPNKKLVKLATEKLQIKISDAKHIKFAEWTADYEGTPISVDCQIIGANKEETYTKYAEAYCYKCDHHEPVQDINKMPTCPNENCQLYKKEMDLLRSSLKTGDTKIILIQEPLEESKHGSPRILEAQIRDKDVYNAYIGQRKKLIGFRKSIPQQGKQTNRILVHVISLQDLEDHTVIVPTKEQLNNFKKMAQDENYIKILQKSFAPEIWGEDLSKLCVMLSILGGTSVGRLRGELHCLLIGDPGTGKSKILEFVPLILPRSGFAVGGTLTGSGITVTLDTLPNRTKMPRAGIVPQCTGSVAVIDELNQVEKEDLGKLYESMASGKIHYNKAGFDLELLAETAILAGANPKRYRYDFDDSIVDNINLPAPLLERFSLLVNMLSKKPIHEQQQKSAHIFEIRRHGVDAYIAKNNLLKVEDLSALLNAARSLNPELTLEAEKVINEFYIMMLGIDQKEGSIEINTRFEESVIRVATAYAKLHFSDKVTAEHAMLAIEIIKACLRTFQMNTEGEKVELNLTSEADNKDAAFTKCFRQEQARIGAEWIEEKPFLNRLVADFSEFFPTIDKAQREFDKRFNRGDVSKKGGLYRLN